MDQEKYIRKRTIIKEILLMLLVLLILGLLAVWFGSRMGNKKLEPDGNVQVGSLTKDAAERKAELQKVVDESVIRFSINATPYFKTGGSAGNLLIENKEGSRNRFTVEIRLKKGQESVYQSGYVKPGQYIEKAKLTKVLPPGKHKAVAYFKAYDLKEDTYIGQAGAEVTLYVGE